MTRGATGALRVRIEQLAPVLGEPERNLARIARLQADAAADAVDLLVTPELSLTGYDLRDRSAALAVPLAEDPFPQLSADSDVVLGVVERGDDLVAYNTAVHLRRGRVLHRHRKLYLPTYGMFDEARYFGAGDRVRTYDFGGGWRMGLLVCEDLWHPALTYLLALGGANLIVVIAAPVGRSGGASEAAGTERFASQRAWEQLAAAAAFAYGAYVVLANRVGVEGACVFAGGSLVLGPDGSLAARARALDEDRLTVELRLDAVAAARRPFAHNRDEDPHLVVRELEWLLGEGRA